MLICQQFFSKWYIPIYALTLNTVCFKIYLYMCVCVHILYIHAIYSMYILYLQMMCNIVCIFCTYKLYMYSLLLVILLGPLLMFFCLTGGHFWNACVLLLDHQQCCNGLLLKNECFCLVLGFIGVNKFIQVQKII